MDIETVQYSKIHTANIRFHSWSYQDPGFCEGCSTFRYLTDAFVSWTDQWVHMGSAPPTLPGNYKWFSVFLVIMVLTPLEKRMDTLGPIAHRISREVRTALCEIC